MQQRTSSARRASVRSLLLGGCFALANSCLITTSHDGELEVRWSIGSTTKSSLCSAHDADEIQISVYDEDGGLVERVAEDCESFSVSLDDLEEGEYTVAAVLIDDDGNEVTAFLGPKDVEIDDGGSSAVSFNFSSSTFLYSVGRGSFALDWEVDDSVKDSACESWGVEALLLRLYDADGDQWGDDYTENCTDFSLTVTSIPEGIYTGRIRLEDENGNALTSWETIEDIVIVEDETTHKGVEFEATAIDGPLVTGELEIEWTIASESDELWCELYDVESIELRLLEDDGTLHVDPVEVPCEAFAATISELPVGDYSIGAVLVDATGDAVSTTVSPVDVTISADNVTLQEFDFPEASFF